MSSFQDAQTAWNAFLSRNSNRIKEFKKEKTNLNFIEPGSTLMQETIADMWGRYGFLLSEMVHLQKMLEDSYGAVRTQQGKSGGNAHAHFKKMIDFDSKDKNGNYDNPFRKLHEQSHTGEL